MKILLKIIGNLIQVEEYFLEILFDQGQKPY